MPTTRAPAICEICGCSFPSDEWRWYSWFDRPYGFERCCDDCYKKIDACNAMIDNHSVRRNPSMSPDVFTADDVDAWAKDDTT